jgi:phage-related protein
MNERLSKAEIRKDAVQDTVQAAAGAVGQVATIITSAVKDVAGTVGGFATELFEIRESARRAAADQTDVSATAPATPDLHVDPESLTGTVAAPDVHPDPDAPLG